ncbi:unnamed protein product [Symbiodinium necroappetens]|uniref:Uncharacterized protein n=1 Tax=Symbiodinium necroappetens TaxID=1628268 RepID=A0A813CSM5_9DINO|nr:unnamed protein product [Symbiodinium necroappetens]
MAARGTLFCLALAAIFACGDAIRSHQGDAIRSQPDSVPVLYLSDACTFTELADRRDGWKCGDEESLVDAHEGARKHADMADAPEVAKNVAAAMKDAAPGLGEFQICGSSEASDGGEIIVIGQPGSDPKKACLKALGIRKMVDDDSIREHTDPSDPELSGVWSFAKLEPLDVRAKLKTGFNGAYEGDEGPGDAGEKKQILAVTEIMNLKLEKHFVFNFEEEIVTAPIIYGGYASDGSIVGVLSSRVWT